MTKEVFISADVAVRRYAKSLRTLQTWGKKGYILYQVLREDSKNPVWLFESPEARYERTMGVSINN